MAMIYHTAEEIISLGNVEKRWSIDYKELAHIVILNRLTVFCHYETRKSDNITYFVGTEHSFEQTNEKIYNVFGDRKYEIEDFKPFYEDFAVGMSVHGEDEEVYYFLLTAEVHKYETENPYLLGRLLEGQEAQEVFQQTAQADSSLSDSLPQAPTPLPSPIGRQSEAQDNARVAKLEEENQDLRDEIERLKLQLAEKATAQGQGVDATQVEELQKELEAKKATLQDALEGHGLCSLVIRERQAGKTDQEIDSELERLQVTRDIHRATLLFRGNGTAAEQTRKMAYLRMCDKEARPVTTLE